MNTTTKGGFWLSLLPPLWPRAGTGYAVWLAVSAFLGALSGIRSGFLHSDGVIHGPNILYALFGVCSVVVFLILCLFFVFPPKRASQGLWIWGWVCVFLVSFSCSMMTTFILTTQYEQKRTNLEKYADQRYQRQIQKKKSQENPEKLEENAPVFAGIIDDLKVIGEGKIRITIALIQDHTENDPKDHEAEYWIDVIIPHQEWVFVEDKLQKEQQIQIPHRGDLVRFQGELIPYRAPLSPTDFNGRLYGLSRNIHGVVRIKQARNFFWYAQETSSASAQEFSISTWLWDARLSLRRRLLAVATPTDAGVLLALLLGDVSLFTDTQQEIYRDVGAGHLLAVSGLQVTALAVAAERSMVWLLSCLPLIGWRGWGKRMGTICALLVVWSFVSLCSSPASAVRSAGMATCVLCLPILKRGNSTGNTLSSVTGFVAWLHLLLDPLACIDAGFLLSYGAVIGLLLSSDDKISLLLWRAKKKSEKNAVMQIKLYGYIGILLVYASAASTILTMPISSAWFGLVAWGGILANAVLVPLASLLQLPAMLLGLAAALLPASGPASWIAGGLASVGAACVGFLEALCAGFGALFGGLTPVSSSLESMYGIPVVLETLFYGCFLSWMSHSVLPWFGQHWFGHEVKRTPAARVQFVQFVQLVQLAQPAQLVPIVWLCLLGVASWVSQNLQGDAQNHGALLRITAIAVGQGDALVVQFPDGRTMLVDGGGIAGSDADIGLRVVKPVLDRLQIHHVDVVVMTHPDADHAAGLISLLDRRVTGISIGSVWVGGLQHAQEPDAASPFLLKRFVERARKYQIPVETVYTLPLEQNWGGVSVEVLGPFCQNERGACHGMSRNDASLVLRLRYGENAVLLLGDVEEAGERSLLDHHTKEQAGALSGTLSAQLVKVAHHGSNTSSIPDLVAQTHAQHAIFSTGRNNRFGFPHAEVNDRWEKSGAHLWNTAWHGELSILVPAVGSVQVHPYRGESATTTQPTSMGTFAL